MKSYYFYSRVDSKKEPISKIISMSRYKAAVHFAKVKQMNLKSFLQCYGISR
jgi:hypothetical protein